MLHGFCLNHFYKVIKADGIEKSDSTVIIQVDGHINKRRKKTDKCHSKEGHFLIAFYEVEYFIGNNNYE